MERYDSGTKTWTTVLCALIAAVIDWLAVVNPVRGFRPDEPDQTWWTVALIVVILPPISWLVGRLLARRWADAVIWTAVVWSLVVAHIAVWTWAQNQL